MLRGLRVVFSPNPVSRLLYSHRVLDPGTRGTVTVVRTAGSVRTYIAGPGVGLVCVECDMGSLGCALEPDENERR